jgi:hypothetical protein
MLGQSFLIAQCVLMLGAEGDYKSGKELEIPNRTARLKEHSAYYLQYHHSCVFRHDLSSDADARPDLAIFRRNM